jgi:hypothetical protein
MTTTEDVLKEFDEKFNGVLETKFTTSDPRIPPITVFVNDKIKQFLLSALARQRQSDMEEVMKMCEEMKLDEKINPDTGMPYYSEYWKGFRDGQNVALTDIQSRLEANMKKV